MSGKEKSGITWMKRFAVLFAVSLATYAGCAKTSTNTNPSGAAGTPGGGPPAQAANVGMDVCVNCHYGTAQAWLTGQHGNMEDKSPVYNPSLNDLGFPYFGFSEWDNTCYKCHDPLGDSKHLITDVTGNYPRPVIGCESCHGGGSNHFGIGAIPYAAPDHSQCGQCHSKDFPSGHLLYHPNGSNIMEDYEQSGHSHSINSHNYVTDSATDVKAICSRCHTAEGFEEYVGMLPETSSHDDIVNALQNEPPIQNATNIECYTCHDPHTASAYGSNTLTRIPASVDLKGNPQSSEFNTCASCHQLVNPDGAAITDCYHDPSVNPYGGTQEIIVDTHAAVPGDTRLNTGTGELPLLMVKKGDSNACAACHSPHLASAEINRQWRESGHGNLLDTPFTEQDFDNPAGSYPCKRCHTATGFKNFATSAASYNPASNAVAVQFYYLKSPTTGNSGQNEALYCWACHSDYHGTLRNPGPITPSLIATGYAGIPPTTTYAIYRDWSNTDVTFPDLNASNVCLSCHSGRESGGNIHNDGATNFVNGSFRNSHYLAAGGVMFTKIGYEFSNSGRNYANPDSYLHDSVGTTAAPNTGSNGPCVECHMNTPQKHLFSPVSVDENTGNVTAVTSLTCAICHAVGSLEGVITADILNENESEFQDALSALADQLAAKRGFYFSPQNPYIFTAPYDPAYNEATASPHCQKNIAVRNWQTGGNQPTPGWNGSSCCFATTGGCVGYAAATTPGTAGAGKDNMGAAFNLNMLEHEPAAFVHNSTYASRLIYDSIDLIDDGLLNDSVAATLNAYTTEPFKTGAIAFILTSPSCSGAACRP